MLKFDFTNYVLPFIDKDKYDLLNNQKESIIKKLKEDKMTGWYNNQLSNEILDKIKIISEKVKQNSDILLIIGIGGSYMGSYSMSKIFLNENEKHETEVIYIGNNLSSRNLKEVVSYIGDKKVSINVISKSGETLEVNFTYKYIKNYMENKYSAEELKERIIITTNLNSGFLKEEIERYGFINFNIPEDVGGRYSILTPAHLFPMAVMNIDIDEFIKGYYSAKEYINDAYQYACNRKLLFDNKFYIENYSVYEPKLYYYTEFLKQLFSESEGKDNKGIFPVSTVNTRDLHSLGQFIQEGNKIIFETVLKVNNKEDIVYDNVSLNNYNDLALKSVVTSHYNGGVPNNIIEIGECNECELGQLTMFFMMSAAISGYLFGVNPYNQDGVEKYKSILKMSINNKR